jgi:DNA polymerase-3 subunit delta'
MSWQNVRGHESLVETIRHVIESGRLPHAFLFVGPEGVGKHTFARKLAQAMLCERRDEAELDPCGICPGCVQVSAETHPDLLLVHRPEDKHELPIQTIRELCRTLSLKPARGSHRFAIVADADDLNEESSNAFLKTLEEPPPGSVLILIGTEPEAFLDTIVSRCRVLRFDRLTDDDVAAILLDRNLAESAAEAERMARLSNGSVRRAIALADPVLAEFRRGMFEEIASPGGFDAPGLARRVDTFCREAGKEGVLHRERACVLIGELVGLFRGVLWQTAGLAPPSPDPDDRDAARSLAETCEPEDVFLLAERCVDAEAQIKRMTNLTLVFESLAHDLDHILSKNIS